MLSTSTYFFARTNTLFQDGFHELVNEAGDMKVKYIDDCIAWILKRVDGASTVPL